MERSDTVKAILVLNEMPENCLECPIGKNISIPLETCMQCPIGKCVIDEEVMTRPNWCPLKPMPSKIGIEEALKMKRSGCIADVINSYNACIDEILGDKE